MLTELTSLINKINSSVVIVYENTQMANVVADTQDYSKYYCLIREFQEGSFVKSSNGQKFNKPKVNIYLYKFNELEDNAINRESIRKYIHTYIIKPLFDELCKSSLFNGQMNWYYPPFSQFDANECGTIIEFEYTSRIC